MFRGLLGSGCSHGASHDNGVLAGGASAGSAHAPSPQEQRSDGMTVLVCRQKAGAVSIEDAEGAMVAPCFSRPQRRPRTSCRPWVSPAPDGLFCGADSSRAGDRSGRAGRGLSGAALVPSWSDERRPRVGPPGQGVLPYAAYGVASWQTPPGGLSGTRTPPTRCASTTSAGVPSR